MNKGLKINQDTAGDDSVTDANSSQAMLFV